MLSLSWWSLFSGIENCSEMESGMGAGAAHIDDVDVLAHFALLSVVGLAAAAASACTFIKLQKSSP